jgi:DNA-binding transcriptional LysR family regulator
VPNLRTLVLLMCQEAGFHPIIAQETIQAQTMISLVQSGLGVALVAGVASRYSTADIKFLDIASSHSANLLGLALAMPRNRKNPIGDNFRRMALRIKSEVLE